MPQAIPMVAAWAAAAWTSAVTVTAGALASVGTVAAIGEGATIALASGIVKTAALTAMSAAASALMRPKTPSTGTTLDFKPDPKAPVRGAMGFTAVGGNKVFQATWGYKRVAMSLGVALSLGPIQGVAAFEADGSVVSFNPADQYEALGFYGDDMWQRTTLGLPGDAALLPPTGLKYGNPGLTGWGSANAAPQTAFAFWTMVLAKNAEDRDVFTNGVPDPRWILNGMRLWQPRYDSTYPGGSGPQRRDDWRTWGWTENPYDHALAWVRGHYKLNTDGTIDKTKRIAGVGAPDSAIDIPAFVEGANVADANAWTISGEWSTSDGKWQTLVAMLQAGGGQPINRGAQISVLVNTPRVSTYTYTKADLVGQAQVKPLTPRRDRKNTIIPRYRSQANGWEYVAAGEVTSATYRTEDRGEQRSTEVEYVHVRDARQVGQLAAYDLVTLREGLSATLPSKVHLLNVHAGDCITVNEPELAMVNQKFVVMRTTTDYKSAVVTLELRSETDAKHAFALGQTGQAPPSPTLSAVNPRYIDPPVSDDWSVVPLPPTGGTSQPVVVVVGATETADIASVVIETGPTEAGPWSTIYAGAPLLDGRYPSSGLQPGQQYWVSVRHVARNGAISDRLIRGPVTAGDLVAGDVSPNAPTILQQRADIDALADLQASETVIRQEQIDSLTARSNQAANLIDNPSGAADPAGSASIRSWIKEGGPNVQLINDQEVGRIFVVGDYMVSQVYPASPGQKHSLSYNASPVGGGHVRLQYITPSGAVEGVRVDNTLGEKAERRRSSAPSVAPAGTTGFRLIAAPPSGGVLPVWAIKVNFGDVATDFTDDYSANVLQADVSITKTIVLDLDGQNALARLSLVAAASGSVPARIGLTSSTLGSAITFDAPYIYWGTNTVFDDATDTLQTTVGSNVRILAFGAPFGASGNLLEWWGPASIGLGAMTTGNGLNGRMTTAPYVFDNVTGGARQALVSVTDRSVTTSWTLMAQYDMGGVSAGSNGVVVAADFDIGTFLFVPSGSGITDFYGEMQLRELAQDGSGAAVLGTKAFNSTSGDPSAYVVAQGSRTGAVRYQVWMRSTQPGESATIGGRVQFQAAPNG